MELDVYLRGLIRRWFLVLLMLGIGALAASIYFSVSGKETAKLTVAVMEPAMTDAPRGVQAQVTFDSVIQSESLAQKVITRLGLTDTTAQDLSREISAKLSPALIPNVITPLYIIQVKHKDPSTAVLIAETAVEEASEMFLEMNNVDIDQYGRIYESQQLQARADVDRAMTALDEFRQTHGIYALSSQIALQAERLQSLTDDLRQGWAAQRMNNAVEQAAQADLEEIRRQRDAAEGQLSDLSSEQAEYNLLLYELQLAESLLNQVTTAETQLNLAETVGSYHEGVRESLVGLGQITEPASFSTVRGSLDILGTAIDPDFWKYEVQVSPHARPDQWTVLGVYEKPVEDGQLEVWNTTAFPDGSYAIRLRVVRNDGNYSETVVRQVWIDNTGRGRQDGLETSTGTGRLFDARGEEVAPALRPALDRAVDWVDEAQKNLMDFEQRYDAASLYSQLDAQVAEVSGLTGAEREVLADQAYLKAGREAQEQNLTELADQVGQEREELEYLLSLAPQYERLQFEYEMAYEELSQLNTTVRYKLLEETSLEEAQVMLLDSASIEPRLIQIIATYAVSSLLGLAVGLVLVYVLVYFDRKVYTAAEAESMMEAPVWTTIPRG